MQNRPMPVNEPGWPEIETLTDALNSIIAEQRSCGPITVTSREPNWYMSSYRSEIIGCRFADGTERSLFCKYASEGHGHNGHGHWGGVAYEAEVYRQILQHAPVSMPRYCGTYTGEAEDCVWLFLEFLGGCERLHQIEGTEILLEASRWLARFHRSQEQLAAGTKAEFLNRYEASYLRGWARRTAQFAEPLGADLPWLGALSARFEEGVERLVQATPTVIHGEFYPMNILVNRGTIFPVDWESAAIGPGEIDLAGLTEGWPADVVQACKCEYARMRWPEGTPSDFDMVFATACLYLHFRWLGDQPEYTVSEDRLGYFEELCRAGQRIGWIG